MHHHHTNYLHLIIIIIIILIGYVACSEPFPSLVYDYCQSSTSSCNPRVSMLSSLQLENKMYYTAYGTYDNNGTVQVGSNLYVTTEADGTRFLGNIDLLEASVFIKNIHSRDEYLLIHRVSGNIYKLNVVTDEMTRIQFNKRSLPVYTIQFCGNDLYGLFYTGGKKHAFVKFDHSNNFAAEIIGSVQNSTFLDVGLVCLENNPIVSTYVGIYVYNVTDSTFEMRYTMCDDGIDGCVAVTNLVQSEYGIVFFTGMTNTNVSSLYTLDLHQGPTIVCSRCHNARYLTPVGNEVFFFTPSNDDDSSKSQVLWVSDNTGFSAFILKDFVNSEDNFEFYSHIREQKSILINDYQLIFTMSNDRGEAGIWQTNTLTDTTTKLYSSLYIINNLVYNKYNHKLYFNELQSTANRPDLSSTYTFAQLQELDISTGKNRLIHIQCRSEDCGSPIYYASGSYGNFTGGDSTYYPIFYGMQNRDTRTIQFFEQEVEVPQPVPPVPSVSVSTSVESSPIPVETTSVVASSSNVPPPPVVSSSIVVTSSSAHHPSKGLSTTAIVLIVTAIFAAVIVLALVVALVIRFVISRRQQTYEQIY
jgi:hypothetical protein